MSFLTSMTMTLSFIRGFDITNQSESIPPRTAFQPSETNKKIQGIWDKFLDILKSIASQFGKLFRVYIWEKTTHFWDPAFIKCFSRLFFCKQQSDRHSTQAATQQETNEFYRTAPREGKKITGLIIQTVEQLTLSSCLKEAGLSENQIQTIELNAKSVLRLDDFIKRNPTQGEVCTILGTCLNGLIFDLENIVKSRNFIDAYVKLTGSPVSNTPLFMSKLMEEGKSVVLFIPYDLSKASTTASEIDWLIQHPKKMKNVHFVYGAYDVLKSPYFGMIQSNKFTESQIEEYKALVFKYALKQLSTQLTGTDLSSSK